MQDDITARKREALIGTTVEVLVDARGVARSHREAPEIDGIVRLVDTGADGLFARPGAIVPAIVSGVAGPDLEAIPVALASEREVAS